MIKYLVQPILLNHHFKFLGLSKLGSEFQFFLVFNSFTNHHSIKLVRDRISKTHNLLPILYYPIKFRMIAHYNQEHDALEYYILYERKFHLMGKGDEVRCHDCIH